MYRNLGLSALSLGVAASLGAGEVFTSGPEQVALIELFTSEGCSSCPPAERWLGERRSDPALWSEFVPVAFHVTYWDNLGWPDRFARRDFTERQYVYSEAWGSRAVYTPGFVRNGREWRPGQSTEPPKLTGVLTLERMSAETWSIEYVPAEVAESVAGFDLELAILGGGIVSAVQRGENSGRTLHHEFVALTLTEVKLALAGGGTYAARVTQSLPAVNGVSKLAVAAWIKPENAVEPVQAVGGWISQ